MDAVLINNLLDSLGKFTEKLTPETKEQILKETIARYLDEIINLMNAKYENVKFWAIWVNANCEQTMSLDGLPLMYNFEDQEVEDEDYEYIKRCERYDYNPRIDGKSLTELSIKLLFKKTIECNLGHKHHYTRYYIFSIAKIMTIISDYQHDPRFLDTFVEKFIPTFFDA